jgi:enterochelin esterase-like enzyme
MRQPKTNTKLALLVLSLFCAVLVTGCSDSGTINQNSFVSAAGIATPSGANSTAQAAVSTDWVVGTSPGSAASTPVPNTPTPAPKPTSTPVPTPTPYPTPKLKIPLVGATTPVDFTGKGQVVERQFYSNNLKKNVSYRIYLPQGYNSAAKRYPVLYMLHGFSGKIDEWMWYGIMGRVDDLISSGKIKPMLVVLPQGDQEYWVDHPNDGLKWGAYTAHEVVDHIDGNYKTLPLKGSRAIGGLSMGSTGALQLVMNYPGIFGVVGAHSPAMRTFDQKLPWWGDEDWYAKTDPVTLAKTSDALNDIKLWIDVGANDSAWRARVLEFKQILEDRKIPFTYTEWPGDHNGDYWTAHMVDYLNYYGSALSFG